MKKIPNIQLYENNPNKAEDAKQDENTVKKINIIEKILKNI